MIVALAIEDELAHELVIPILGSLEAKSLSKIAIVRRFGTPTVTNWKKIRDLWMKDRIDEPIGSSGAFKSGTYIMNPYLKA